jgi:hypothetical protein
MTRGKLSYSFRNEIHEQGSIWNDFGSFLEKLAGHNIRPWTDWNKEQERWESLVICKVVLAALQPGNLASALVREISRLACQELDLLRSERRSSCPEGFLQIDNALGGQNRRPPNQTLRRQGKERKP